VGIDILRLPATAAVVGKSESSVEANYPAMIAVRERYRCE